MRPSTYFALRLLPCMAIPAPAFALIDISPKEIEVREQPASVRIINKGDRPEYVSITLSRLLNPGVELDSERLEPITLAQKPLLYASPFRLTLAPGQSKTITLKPLQGVEQEQVYRLNVTPIINLQETASQATSGNVVINLSFNGLVRQLPNAERAQLSVSCVASGALLTASGNVRYPVKDMKINGEPVPPFNVYPGEPKLMEGKLIYVPDQPAC